MKIPQVARDLFAGGLVSCHLLTCAITGGTCALLRAATTDTIPDEEIHAPTLATLSAENEKKAQAISFYMQGILDEESSGPEKAFENYRHVLDLEPGFSELAIYIAHEHLRRGESAEAIGVLKDALKNKPKDMSLCLGLSSIYLRQLHKPDIALQYAQRALDINGEEFAPYEAFWEIYQTENQKGRARQILERATKSKSTSSFFWLQLGKLAGQSYIAENGDLKPDDVQKVSPFFERALEYANGDLATTNHVADFFTLTKQCERAIPLYQRVLSSNPDFGGALESLALCYARSGKSQEAIDAYQQVIDKDATKVGAYDEIAELAMQMGDNKRALLALRQAMLIDPSEPGRYEKAGGCALDLSKADDAVKIFTEARIRFPSYPEFTHLLGIALSQAARHAEAMQVFARAIFEANNQRPGMLDSRFYGDYGMAAEEAKQYGKAEEMLKKSIDMDPDHAARSYNALGYMWVDRGERLEEAEVVIRKAVEIDPNSAMYIDSLGWLFYQQGKYQDALSQLQRASELLSNHPDAVVFEHLGDTYQKLGQFAQAVLAWQKSIALDSKNKAVLAKIDEVSKKVVNQQSVTTP